MPDDSHRNESVSCRIPSSPNLHLIISGPTIFMLSLRPLRMTAALSISPSATTGSGHFSCFWSPNLGNLCFSSFMVSRRRISDRQAGQRRSRMFLVYKVCVVWNPTAVIVQKQSRRLGSFLIGLIKSYDSTAMEQSEVQDSISERRQWQLGQREHHCEDEEGI